MNGQCSSYYTAKFARLRERSKISIAGDKTFYAIGSHSKKWAFLEISLWFFCRIIFDYLHHERWLFSFIVETGSGGRVPLASA